SLGRGRLPKPPVAVASGAGSTARLRTPPLATSGRLTGMSHTTPTTLPAAAPTSRRRLAAVVTGATFVLAGVTACASSEPASCADLAAEDGYRVLLDGTEDTLDQWRMAGPGSFEPAEDCSVVTVGGMGLLWF